MKARLTAVTRAICSTSFGANAPTGMIGVTTFGVFLTPVFYYVIMWRRH
jgi:hypothetical protein